jgi:hypothetical protein
MSLRGDKYETADEIRMRLEGCVVLYDGKPVIITDVGAGGEDEDGKKEIARVYFNFLPLKRGAAKERRYLSSRKFDLAPFKMGYCNYKGEVVRVSRVPVRQNRQGLSYGVTSMTDVFGTRRDYNWNDFISSTGFSEMVAGVYPGFDAIKQLSAVRTSIALSRDFAAVFDDDLDLIYLVHNGSKCGLIDKNVVRLSKKFGFLKESLQELKAPLL